jgi:monoamine oxidase
LALPFSLLREVDRTGLTLSDEKKDVIDHIGYGTNAKVMAGFSSRPWWTTHGSTGSLTCDLPVQQTWDSTVGQEPVSGAGVLTNFLGGDQGLASGDGTPEAWVNSVMLPALETVWPGSQAAYTPDSAVRMHWPTSPFSKGSYTCYRPGQWAYWSTEGTREGNLHFCGEHCSLDFQGWMEGAAETGALAASEVLEDLSVSPSAGLSALLSILTVVPQPYARFASDLRRLTPFARRRRLRDLLRGS